MKVVHVSELSNRLTDAKGDRSIDAVVAQASKAGHEINRATVARYVAGDGAKTPPDSVLRALAAGLDLDVRELRVLAGRPAGELGPWTPVQEAAQLSREQRDALDTLIKSIVNAGGGEGRADAGPTTMNEPSSGSVTKLRPRDGQLDAAARRGDGPTRGQRDRAEADRAGEPPADDPSDLEPR